MGLTQDEAKILVTSFTSQAAMLRRQANMLDEAVTLLSLRYNVIPSSTRDLSPCESMEVPKP